MMPYRPKTLNLRPKPRRDDRKAERDAFYSSARWMRLRAAFLCENPLCVRCLTEDIVEVAVIAHHKVERLADPSLSLDSSNLEALCESCHSKHHKATHLDGRKSGSTPPGTSSRRSG
jgi:5-methylcytosine-specific restriction enzyme A